MTKGRVLGGYEILEEIGRGAMGVVFKARQLSMDRDVAIKFLPQRLAEDKRIVARFIREARAAGQLSHPNIVSVHDVGLVEGLHYIAMEFVDGASVQKIVKDKGRLSEDETLHIAEQVCEGLKVAHTNGILHRDVKPDNFLRDKNGRVRLADLGLARVNDASESDAGLTEHGTTMGTPHFMSPEQCAGEELDVRSDLYSLGASLYVMATGKTPYEGTSGAQVMMRVLSENPRSLRKARPDLSNGFIAMVEKMMAKDPAKRFQTAQEAVDAIKLCKMGKFPIARVLIGRAKAGLEQKPHIRWWLYGAGAGVASLFVLVLVVIVSAIYKNRNNPTPVTPSANTTAKTDDKRGISNLLKEFSDKTSVKTLPDETAKKTADTGKTTNPPKPPDVKTPAPAKNTDTKTPPRTDDKHLTKKEERKEERIAENGGLKHADKGDKGDLKGDLPSKKPLPEALRKRQEEAAREWPEVEKAIKIAQEERRHEEVAKICVRFMGMFRGTPEADKARKVLMDDLADPERLSKLRESLKKPAVAKETASTSGKTTAAPATSERDAENERKLLARTVKENSNAIGKPVIDAANRAADAASDTDALTGYPYHFAEAARVCREYANKLDPAQKKDRDELEIIANVYDTAETALTKLKTAINNGAEKPVIASLWNKKSAKLLAWADEGLKCLPTGSGEALGEQIVRWKNVSDALVMNIAAELSKAQSTDPQIVTGLAALAYAIGDEDETLIRAQQAMEANPTVRPAYELISRLVQGETVANNDTQPNQPASAAERESAAQQLFERAMEEKNRGNKIKCQDLINKAAANYADTKFVQAHRDEIQKLGTP